MTLSSDRLLRVDRTCAALLPSVLLAGGLLRLAVHPGHLLGQTTSEAYGRLFATEQVRRWTTGAASWGSGDLLAWPDGRPFWPIAPLLEAIALPVSALLGAPAGLTAAVGALLVLAGWGPLLLARRLGASTAGAVVAGLLVQLSPFLLQHAEDVVVEVLAIGLLALAMERILVAVDSAGAPAVGWAGLAIGALALSSPYYAVYLALGCALVLPWTLRRWRRWSAVAGVGAVACGLALLPLMWTEQGPGGRLSTAHEGTGYALRPERPVHVDGRPARQGPPRGPATAPSPGAPPPGAPPLGAPPPGAPPAGLSDWTRALPKVPGGLALSLGIVGALLPRGRRWWGALALAVWALGPALPQLLRRLGLARLDPTGAFGWLLQHLPLTTTLGNHSRLLALVVIGGAVGAGLLVSRWRVLALPLLALAGLEAWAVLPGLAVPTVPCAPERELLARAPGPLVVFPSGDPPVWSASVAPKETLFLAALAGQPTAYDFGRGAMPADLGVQAVLAVAGDLPMAPAAWAEASRQLTQDDFWAQQPFEAVLVLEDRLSPPERAGLRDWLTAHAEPVAQGERSSLWQLPEAAPVPSLPRPERPRP